MVPVLDADNKPLMPCTEKRATLLMRRGKAVALWQKSIFCIRLTVEPLARHTQDVTLGIDPGSKREGYTVLTKKAVVMNITSSTPDWVKRHVETRRNLRRARRQRKTPYRACRENRACLRRLGRIPPSTKARWGAKLRIVAILTRILPITHINVENISAETRKGRQNRRWNATFSPLQVGKAYFSAELARLYPDVTRTLTEGHQTSAHRKTRGFPKSKAKLDWTWDAHNSDSHTLAELALGHDVAPHQSMYRIEFLRFHRRALHLQVPAKGGARRRNGGTVSMGMSRGSVVRYRGQTGYYLGGSSKGRVSIHSTATGVRFRRGVKVSDIQVLYQTRHRTQFLHHKGVGLLVERS